MSVEPSVKGWIYPTRNDLALIAAPEGFSDAFDGLPLGNPAALKGWEPLYLVGINPVLKPLNWSLWRKA